ncbi:MAG: alkylhydroperoxidase-related (seleno)protein, partial [Alphaproteobacteria bacterium]
MPQIDYDDSPYPVRNDLTASHRRAWDKLSNAGTWLTGEERVKVMAETRHARESVTCANIKEALSPFSATDPKDSATDLPENWITMIQLIVADPG